MKWYDEEESLQEWMAALARHRANRTGWTPAAAAPRYPVPAAPPGDALLRKRIALNTL